MNVKFTIYFSVEEKCNHFTTLQDQHQTAHWWWLVECFPQVEFLLRRNTLFFSFFLNPLHPYISMQILYTSPKVMTRKYILTSQEHL